jgi:hypothetical protein
LPVEVSKELPDKDGFYIVQHIYNGKTIGSWSVYFDVDTKPWFSTPVTHWLKPVPLSELIADKCKELELAVKQISEHFKQ